MDAVTSPVPVAASTSHAHEAAWKRAQAIAGVVFLGFASLHLINTALGAIPGAYDGYQRVIRQAYQSPVVEIVGVLLPLLVHVAAGLRGIVKRRRQARAKVPLRLRLHRWAAWYLLLVVAGHVAATRLPSLLEGIHLEQLGVAFAVAWLPWFFVPYYTVLGVAGVYHAGQGAMFASAVLGARVPARWVHGRGSALVLGALALVVVVGLAGVIGWIYALPADPLATPYADLYRHLAAEGWAPAVPDPR